MKEQMLELVKSLLEDQEDTYLNWCMHRDFTKTRAIRMLYELEELNKLIGEMKDD